MRALVHAAALSLLIACAAPPPAAPPAASAPSAGAGSATSPSSASVAPASSAPSRPLAAPVLELAEVRFERPLPLDSLVSKSDGHLRYDSGKIMATAFEDGRVVDRFDKELARILTDGTVQGVTQEPLRIDPSGDAVGGASGGRIHIDEHGNVIAGGVVIEKLVVHFASATPSAGARRFAMAMLLAGAAMFGGELDTKLFDDPRCEYAGTIGAGGSTCKCHRELDGRSYALSCADGTSAATSCTCVEGGRASAPRPAKVGVCSSVLDAWAECGFPGRRLRASASH